LTLDRLAELAPPDCEDAAALSDLVFLRSQRNGRVGLALRNVDNLARRRVVRELVAFARISDSVGALHDMQAEIECVAPEDVAHVLAADDDHLAAHFFRDRLEAGRRHLARRADRATAAGTYRRRA